MNNIAMLTATHPGLMAVSLGLYLVGWQHGNIRGQRKEAERIEALRASGFLRQREEETRGEEEKTEKRSSAEEEEEEEEQRRSEEIAM